MGGRRTDDLLEPSQARRGGERLCIVGGLELHFSRFPALLPWAKDLTLLEQRFVRL